MAHLRSVSTLVGSLLVCIRPAISFLVLFALLFGNVVKVKAGQAEYYAVRAFICDTPVRAKEFARELGTQGLRAESAVNARAGEQVCGVSIFGFIEHAPVARIFVDKKLVLIERVVVIAAYNYFTGRWAQPPPWNRVQYMLVLLPGTAI